MAQISEEDRTTLTAYLDGELDEEASHAFEARLGREPRLRAEAEALKKTWELLDYLPRPEPSASFTHRTLERLAVVDTGKVARKAQRWAWLAPAGWAAAMLLALAGGLLGANYLWPVTPPVQSGPVPPAASKIEMEAQMVQNLGAIENLRLYGDVDDLEFARRLAQALGEEEGDE